MSPKEPRRGEPFVVIGPGTYALLLIAMAVVIAAAVMAALR